MSGAKIGKLIFWMVLMLHPWRSSSASVFSDTFIKDLIKEIRPNIYIQLDQKADSERIQFLEISSQLAHGITAFSYEKYQSIRGLFKSLRKNEYNVYVVAGSLTSLKRLPFCLHGIRKRDQGSFIIILWESEDTSQLFPLLSLSKQVVFQVYVFTKTSKVGLRKAYEKEKAPNLLGNKTNQLTIARNILKSITSRRQLNEPYILMYELCAYCNEGTHQMKLINSWSVWNRFRKPPELKRSFKKSFNGAEVLDVTIPFTGSRRTGLDLDKIRAPRRMKRILAKKMNFKTVTSNSSFAGFVNGSFTGHLGLVQKGKTDISFLSTPMSFALQRLFDVIYPYYPPGSLCIFSKKPSLMPQYLALTKPFTLTVWLTLMAFVIVVGVAIYVLSQFTKSFFGHGHAISFADSMFNSIMVLLWEAVPSLNVRPNLMILLGFWMVTTLVIMNSMTGSLVSHLTTPIYAEKPIDNVMQLKDSERFWFTLPAKYYTSLLDHDDIMRGRVKTAVPHKGLSLILKYPSNSTYIFNEEDLLKTIYVFFLDRNGYHEFYMSKEPVRSLHMVYCSNKNNAYHHELQKRLQQLFESGIMKKLYDDEMFSYFLYGIRIAKFENKLFTEANGKFTLENLYSGLIFVAIGYTLGTMSFIWELFRKTKNLKRVNAVARENIDIKDEEKYKE